MQIPILNGVFTDQDADIRTSYPVNLTPVPMLSGLSKGYLRPSDGIIGNGEGPGVGRGGINWNGVCYRVMGTKLVSVESNGSVSVLGDVGTGVQVTFDYSFDRLAISSGGRFYYWDGVTLQQVTDPDLGTVLDFCWVDGYFMTTDGEFLVVTELNDPFAINPLKYGSSEADPDPIKAVKKVRNEPHALNRYTIEVFDNTGGDFFPFQRIEGAQIQKGVVGTHACCVFDEAIAFMGGGRNESIGVYLGASGDAIKISTHEIDTILTQYSEDQLSFSVLEERNDRSHRNLWVHLPDRTLVYDAAASAASGDQVWHYLTSGLAGFSKYLAKDIVYCYDKWLVSSSIDDRLGYLTPSVSSQFGDIARWEFGTSIVYNGGGGAIFHQVELVGLPGRTLLGLDPQISTSYSVDGVTWSQDKYISVGKSGERNKRLVWFQQGPMRNYRIQRFRGDSQAFIAFARLEVQLEPLSV